MRIVTRQLTKEILIATAFVMVSLLALFAFFDVAGQSSRIGTRYGIDMALQFAVLNLPRRFYQVMPIAALLGGIYTLSRWAAESQFVVWRISGLSAWRLALMLLAPASILIVLTYAVGEWVAPATDRAYTDLRRINVYNTNLKRVYGFKSGVWVKDIVKAKDGRPELVRFVNVGSLSVGEEMKTGAWRVFEFSARDNSLLRIIHAASATHIPSRGWHLKNARIETLPAVGSDDVPMIEKATIQAVSDLVLPSDMQPEILEVLTVKPSAMGIGELHEYIGHLKQMRQETKRYEIEFWNHIVYPMLIFVMLMVALPFAYLNARAGGMAVKIFCGLVIGIVFFGIDNAFTFAGTASALPAMMIPLVPIVLMLVATSAALWLAERR